MFCYLCFGPEDSLLLLVLLSLSSSFLTHVLTVAKVRGCPEAGLPAWSQSFSLYSGWVAAELSPLPSQVHLTGTSGPRMDGFFIAYQIMLVVFIPQQAGIDLQSSEARERKEAGGSGGGGGVMETLEGQSLTSCTGWPRMLPHGHPISFFHLSTKWVGWSLSALFIFYFIF